MIFLPEYVNQSQRSFPSCDSAARWIVPVSSSKMSASPTPSAASLSVNRITPAARGYSFSWSRECCCRSIGCRYRACVRSKPNCGIPSYLTGFVTDQEKGSQFASPRGLGSLNLLSLLIKGLGLLLRQGHHPAGLCDGDRGKVLHGSEALEPLLRLLLQ